MGFKGKYWIDSHGTVHEVLSSHEEWADENRGKSLEALFDDGWIRVQAFPGDYLYVDHAQAAGKPQQRLALESFFFAPDGCLVFYDRILVERHSDHGAGVKEFGKGENRAALEFARGEPEV